MRRVSVRIRCGANSNVETFARQVGHILPSNQADSFHNGAAACLQPATVDSQVDVGFKLNLNQ
jgi:hypothetical protein